jgi:hypothetical protein
MPLDCGMIGQCERFKALGQNHPTQAYFIRCSPECDTFAAEHMDGFVRAAEGQVSGGAGIYGRDASVKSYGLPGDETLCLKPTKPTQPGTSRAAPALFLPDASFSALLAYILQKGPSLPQKESITILGLISVSSGRVALKDVKVRDLGNDYSEVYKELYTRARFICQRLTPRAPASHHSSLAASQPPAKKLKLARVVRPQEALDKPYQCPVCLQRYKKHGAPYLNHVEDCLQRMDATATATPSDGHAGLAPDGPSSCLVAAAVPVAAPVAAPVAVPVGGEGTPAVVPNANLQPHYPTPIYGTHTSARRWNPTPTQLVKLEGLFSTGTGIPSGELLTSVTHDLQRMGAINEANVFNWFQNKKSRVKKRAQTDTAAATEGGAGAHSSKLQGVLNGPSTSDADDDDAPLSILFDNEGPRQRVSHAPGVPGAQTIGYPEAGLHDAGLPNAGLPKAGLPDAGLPDAGFPPTCHDVLSIDE